MAVPDASVTRPTRGIGFRLLGASFGLIIAALLIVGMQLPLLSPQTKTSIAHVSLVVSRTQADVAWPSIGQAAYDAPTSEVSGSHNTFVAPIASLGKMMTAYVALSVDPLTATASGPCMTVTSSDVAIESEDAASGQSNVRVAEGDQLCERTLLEGLFVHSASDYTEFLAQLVSGSTSAFVARMNQMAASLGMSATHYADTSGFSSLTVSDASDQLHLLELLMKNPVVRTIGAMTSVSLPTAGTVTTYTPLLGEDGVVGLKSGRTGAAGGCDAMAIDEVLGGQEQTVYVVVMGQRGGDLITPAGDAAYRIAKSLGQSETTVALASATDVGSITIGSQHTAVQTARAVHLAWRGADARVNVSVSIARVRNLVHKGQAVGWLLVGGADHVRVPLVATTNISSLSLWQRLR
jgi:D-alanyl-D-alanine carboxypeptidase (penicillin-binding protein 5/6)